MNKFGKGRSKFVRKHVRGKRILDIGCAGANGLIHKNNVDNNRASLVVGLDNNLRNLAKLKGNRSELILASAECLPLQDASFDCVYLGELIEHFWSAEKLLREVKRVLKISGKICLDTPNVYSLERILRFVLRGEDSLGDQDHKIFYTPASVSKLLQNIGFQMIEITSDGKIPFARRELTISFPPFKWLGSHLCLVAKKVC
jgi:ubiquinone/menaquinone biosynthesis C-methylase UbiE